MANPFIGEIRIVTFAFAPRGWATCAGQILPINQNQALFSLLGTTYGGNGSTTFALPDLRGRAPFHFGGALPLGSSGGEETHTLTPPELPTHSHRAHAGGQGTTASPAGAFWANGGKQAYASAGSTPMAAEAVASAGGSQPHENMPPFLVITFVIALQGIFPSRS